MSMSKHYRNKHFFNIMARFFLFFLFTFLIVSVESVYGQDAIPLFNASFEDYPRAERVPRGWKDCGFPNESAPDTHPGGAFQVIKKPSHGNTYLGMVVRDNDTWERVSQQLLSPIQANQCYSFIINLCRSELYVSLSRVNAKPANYVQPIKLVIWGGDDYCSKKERLAESPLISNTEWEAFSFKFEPKQTHTFIMLEAFYKTPVLFPYNGNILVDKASEIVPIPCDEAPLLAEIPSVNFVNFEGKSLTIARPSTTVEASVKNIRTKSDIILEVNGREVSDFTFDVRNEQLIANLDNLKKGSNNIVIQATNTAGTSEDRVAIIYRPEDIAASPPIATTPSTPAEEPIPDTYEVPAQKQNILIDIPKEQLQEGQILKIRALSFQTNDSTINRTAYQYLDKISDFLVDNTDVVIEIGGHTNGLCEDSYCNQLSAARAKAVADYLASSGVNNRQLKYKGYGKTRQIASNNTVGGRKKNQRVEIKILEKDG